jgi:hypothetical protein
VGLVSELLIEKLVAPLAHCLQFEVLGEEGIDVVECQVVSFDFDSGALGRRVDHGGDL